MKSFEDAMNELEKVVDELEKEDLTLEQSVTKFQEGMELSQYCNKMLEEAEKKITILIENSDGNVTEEEFNLEKEEENTKDGNLGE